MPSGFEILTLDGAGNANIWLADSGKLLRTLGPGIHTNAIQAAIFPPCSQASAIAVREEATQELSTPTLAHQALDAQPTLAHQVSLHFSVHVVAAS